NLGLFNSISLLVLLLHRPRGFPLCRRTPNTLLHPRHTAVPCKLDTAPIEWSWQVFRIVSQTDITASDHRARRRDSLNRPPDRLVSAVIGPVSVVAVAVAVVAVVVVAIAAVADVATVAVVAVGGIGIDA